MIATVFCVDDDPITIMLCEKALKKAVFCNKIISAINGEVAINYFKEQANLPANEQQIPHLILLDLNMPLLNGWEFMEAFNKQFAAKFKQVKVAILSSSVNQKDKLIVNEFSQIIAYLTKPLDAKSLEFLRNHNDLKHYFQ